MIGAIIGDICGSVFEFNNTKDPNFELFSENSHYTDDTVMTIAIAKALLDGKRDIKKTEFLVKKYMHKLGNQYQNVGYGNNFSIWLKQKDPKPYESFGNGSAMRVSPVGWFSHSLSETEKYAELTASITHNHAEGIKGAKAIATCIFLSRRGRDKNYIKKFIEMKYGYDLSKNLEDIKDNNKYDVSCQVTVPIAIMSFLLADSFEDTLRNAITIGGDSDTIAAMACSIAESYYEIPEELINKVYSLIPKNFVDVISKWDNDLSIARPFYKKRNILEYKTYFLNNPKAEKEVIQKPGTKEKVTVPIYNNIQFNFVEDLKRSNYILNDYKDIFIKHDIKCYEDMIIELPNASELLLEAMLSYILDAEKQNPGVIAWTAEKGIIGDILDRLDIYSQLLC